MKSHTGNYEVTIRRCKDGTYNSELFGIYPDGDRMGLGGDQGIPSLAEARSKALEWMFKTELDNELSEVSEDGDKSLETAVKKALGPDLGKIAKARGVHKDVVVENAVAYLRSLS